MFLSRRSTRFSRTFVGVLLTVSLVALALALALPDLVPARQRTNESDALGDVRRVMSAQTRYAEANKGYYTTLDCLITPSDCLPDFAPEWPGYLPEPMDDIGHGYLRELVAGPPAPKRAGARPESSFRAYAFVTYPREIGVTGSKSFCGDSAGTLCVDESGERPVTVDGQCAPGCRAGRVMQ